MVAAGASQKLGLNVPFRGHLDQSVIRTLTQAAIDADLLEISRSLLLAGISRPYLQSLRNNIGNPLDQFQVDLDALNRIDRLADGEVPLIQLLTNAAHQLTLRGRPQGELFERYANQVRNHSNGILGLPEPSQLPEVVRQEAIIGQDDTVDLAFLNAALSLSRSVARIVVPRLEGGRQISLKSGAPWLMNGTAWLIGPQLAITNHHVINARNAGEALAAPADFLEQGRLALLEFDFDASNAHKTIVAATKLEVASREVDYAVLRLAQAIDRHALRLMPRRVEVHAATYMPVNIVQHPHGQPKRIALRNNLVAGADQNLVRYFTDTDFGSSGSPVCNDKWEVVALHRGATFVQGVQFQGKHTAYINFGSQIQAVLDDLREKSSAVFAEVY